MSAQSTVKKVEQGVSHGAKVVARKTVNTGKKVGRTTKHAAKVTGRAAANMVVGHKILCGDGTWASRDNPGCSGHDGVAAHQPGDKDKH